MINDVNKLINLTKPGLNYIMMNYKQLPAQYKDLFKQHKAKYQVEVDQEIKPLGIGRVRPEGTPTFIDSMSQAFETKYQIYYTALSFGITRMLLDFNKYPEMFPKGSESLKNGMLQAKEAKAADILNSGFFGSTGGFLGGDGKTLFDTAHPLAVGTSSNTPSNSTQISESALENAVNQIRNFRDYGGNRTNIHPKMLYVSQDASWTAGRILNSAFRTHTPNNDVSMINHGNIFPGGVKVNNYITLPNFWMITTDCDNGFKLFQGIELTTNSYVDNATDTLFNKALESYCFGFGNWRAAYGSYINASNTNYDPNL